MRKIEEVIKGTIDVSEEARRTYSHDASIFEVKPAAVIQPQDVEDIKQLVKVVSEQRQKGKNVSIAARNGGTCMSGGSLTQGYVVDVSQLNKIGEINKKSKILKVQGGVMHSEVEKATHPHGLLFAPYTSSHDICGIGGMIGNNASGEKSVKYGATSKNIENLKAILADGNEYEFGPLTPEQLEQKKAQHNFEGELYRQITALIEKNQSVISSHHPLTKKNAAGYALWELWNKDKTKFNLARLFIGAQGTLGIVTEAELKLVDIAPASRMIITPIEDLKDLTSVVTTAMSHTPVTCETFDYHTYNLAKQLYPEDAARAKLADGKHMIIMTLFEGDTQQEADAQAKKAQASLEAMKHKTFWVEDDTSAESYLLIRRKSFKMLLENPTPDYRAMAFLEDTIVPLDRYGDFLAKLEAILAEYDMTYTYAGHIGDGSIRLVPLVNMEAEGAAEKIMELETKVNDLVISFGGSISVDHNDGIIRTPYLEKQFGSEMVDLFAEVKQIFDSLNIFNPGKKVGGTMEYALEHIVRRNK